MKSIALVFGNQSNQSHQATRWLRMQSIQVIRPTVRNRHPRVKANQKARKLNYKLVNRYANREMSFLVKCAWSELICSGKPDVLYHISGQRASQKTIFAWSTIAQQEWPRPSKLDSQAPYTSNSLQQYSFPTCLEKGEDSDEIAGTEHRRTPIPT